MIVIVIFTFLVLSSEYLVVAALFELPETLKLMTDFVGEAEMTHCFGSFSIETMCSCHNPTQLRLLKC